jgi:hypothetical protein
MFPNDLDAQTKVRLIASVCHEVNHAYCEALGDYTQPSWDSAPQWQQDSAIKGVEFTLDTPDSTPEDNHKSWLAEKEAAGWKYGEIKDVEAKTHPCMLPYEQLPLEQRVKDHLFRAVVNALK